MIWPVYRRAQTHPVDNGLSRERYVLQTNVKLPLHKAFDQGFLEGFVGSVLRVLAVGTLSSVAFGLTLLGGVDAKRVEFEWGDSAIAQQVDPQVRADFLSDPLKTKPRDPLLPIITTDGPPSPLELQALRENLDQLNLLARTRFAEGQVDEAFVLFLREIRLRRVLGPIEEFNAIAPVAKLAWEQQRSEEVQLLTLRMREIWQAVQVDLGSRDVEDSEDSEDSETEDVQTETPSLLAASNESEFEVLSAIARVFINLRDVDSSVAVYRQIIDLAIAQNLDPTNVQRELAAYHLTWFQFAEAADVYLTLLSSARAQGNQALEIEYLQQLVYSYQAANSLENAARAQTDLVGLYQATGQEEKLPELLLAIAQNYRALNWTDDAISYYRSAYSAAQRFEQFSISGQVLRDLGGVYRAIALIDEALVAYNLLVPVEEQAYNDYGIMNAYDNIGQLQRQKGNSSEALQAFEKALVIANRLNLDEAYFIEQIESVAQSGTTETP